MSRAAAAACRLPAVLALRAENERARTHAAAERRRAEIAAANLAACEAAERDASEKMQRAVAAEAAGLPEALALRALAIQAQNLAALRQRKFVYHVVRSADGFKWVIDGVPLRSAAEKQHEFESGKCAQCDNPFGFFTAIVTCKVCGAFRCKACAPLVAPQPVDAGRRWPHGAVGGRAH